MEIPKRLNYGIWIPSEVLGFGGFGRFESLNNGLPYSSSILPPVLRRKVKRSVESRILAES